MQPETTIREALADAAARIGGDSPRLDAELLLCHALACSRTRLFAHGEEALGDRAAPYETLVRRRQAGEPVAHLMGRRAFWTLDLAVDASTLIPRPDTEVLVEAALARLAPGATVDVLDLGTGTGAIALAIASERQTCRVVAVEADADAVRLARRNASEAGLERVEVRAGSWFGPVLGQRFALIVSNPPYIAEGDSHLHEGDVRFEPRSALVSGADGLDDLRRIIAAAPAHLLPGGWLLVEHGHDQGEAVRGLMAAAGLAEVMTQTDLGGRERVTGARAPG